MSTQGNEYQSIFSYLQSLDFHFLDKWVIECVNYYKSVNPNVSLDVLKKEVKQQWLLVNLREIKVPSLPPALASKEKVILDGKYAVQVESMIDASVSYYSQFQKLLKVSTDSIEATREETEEIKIKPNRCLTFVICDGVQEIQAMEYQPIKKIKNNGELLPGFKMVIMGPVECRKGMILLKDENVRICGGEVDTLTVTNSLKKLLIRKLELDENDYSDAASMNGVEEEKESSENNLQQVTSADECVETLLSQNDDLFLSLPLDSEILAQKRETEESLNELRDITNENHLPEEDFWSDDTVDHMSNTKKHFLPQEDIETPNQKRLTLEVSTDSAIQCFTVQNSTDIDADRDIFLDDSDELQIPVCVRKKKEPVQTSLSSFFRNNNSGSDTVHRISADLQKPVHVSNKPFVYLRQIKNCKLSTPTVFIVKAIILTLKKKITIENDEFNLKAIITDGSSSVDVEFSSEVLENLLGFSPCEMMVMLKARQTNSAVAQKIKDTFSNAQEKLISINCLMQIRFFPDSKTPIVLSLEEVTEQHIKALKERSLE